MEKTLNRLKDFFAEYPQYIYLIIGIVFLVLFIGTLKNKNWAIDPANSTQKFNYEIFGHKAFRIFIGIIYLLGTIAGFGGFFLYLN
ncbi:immunity 17 family protein [uncultured Aquimarina sp.]|uniref:immunity 17 family protein n=1 Tax=uncultured Aquimarina sp. TaxID=575652 RepID=UPI00262580BF|nr:immunity 17 family protein [uncultured Aquimarina sp.]